MRKIDGGKILIGGALLYAAYKFFNSPGVEATADALGSIASTGGAAIQAVADPVQQTARNIGGAVGAAVGVSNAWGNAGAKYNPLAVARTVYGAFADRASSSSGAKSSPVVNRNQVQVATAAAANLNIASVQVPNPMSVGTGSTVKISPFTGQAFATANSSSTKTKTYTPAKAPATTKAPTIYYDNRGNKITVR